MLLYVRMYDTFSAHMTSKRPWIILGLSERYLLSPQGSPLSLSRSSSREGLGNGSESDNWRERNGAGNGLPGHGDFSSAVSSPKRKQNKSGR